MAYSMCWGSRSRTRTNEYAPSRQPSEKKFKAGSARVCEQAPDAPKTSGPYRDGSRRIKMPIGVNGGLRKDAANAEDQEQSLDGFHARISPFGGRGRGDGITATVDRGLPDDAVSRGNPARF